MPRVWAGAEDDGALTTSCFRLSISEGSLVSPCFYSIHFLWDIKVPCELSPEWGGLEGICGGFLTTTNTGLQLSLLRLCFLVA